MSVSSVSSSAASISALYAKQLAEKRAAAAKESSGTSSTDGTTTDAAFGPPADGQGPQLPSGLKDSLDSIIKDGGTPDEIRTKIDDAVKTYQQSDDYKNLSADDKKSVDDFAAHKDKHGKPPEGSTDSAAAYAQLDQQGSTLKSNLLSLFTSSSTDTSQTDLTALFANLDSAQAA